MSAQTFRPTLTLTHHESGWDGTFGAVLHEVAGVLDDGPVEARLTYWDREIQNDRTIVGNWVSYQDWASITVQNRSETRTVELDDIKVVSI